MPQTYTPLARQGRREMFSPSADPFATSSVPAHRAYTDYQRGQMPGNQGTRSFRNTSYAGGLGGSGPFGFSGGSSPYQNLGQRNVGSANYGAVAGIQNFLGNTGEAGANYLRSLGIMSTINGIGLDRTMAPGAVFDYSGGGGRGFHTAESRGVATDASRGGVGTPGVLGRDAPGAYANPGGQGLAASFGRPGGADAWMRGMASPFPGTDGGMGGSGGTGGSVGSAGGLEERLSDAYAAIIGRGGRTHSPENEAVLSQRAADTVNRGSRDAIETARINAARHGRSSSPDLEARIAQRGTEGATRARQDVSLGQDQDAIRNLLSALGGAGGYIRDRGQLEILLGQLEQQGGLNGLSMILGG